MLAWRIAPQCNAFLENMLLGKNYELKEPNRSGCETVNPSIEHKLVTATHGSENSLLSGRLELYLVFTYIGNPEMEPGHLRLTR